jgi:hypothetical protein
MNQIFIAAILAVAIAASFGVALLLEWISLGALWLLMPARESAQRGKAL